MSAVDVGVDVDRGAPTVWVRPKPDALTEPFWRGIDRRALLIQRCRGCRQFQHWPRPVCRHCRSDELGWDEVSGQATLYSYAVSVQALHPDFEGRVPYVLAVVELVEQQNLKMVTNIVDCEEADLSIGMPVELAATTVADGLTLPFFRPASAGGGT